MWIQLRRFIAIGLLLMGGCLLIWASIPAKRQVVVVLIRPVDMQLNVEEQIYAPTILSIHQMRLDWPGTMRIGDTYRMELSFLPANENPVSSAQLSGFSDAYSTYNIMVETRYEVAGIIVDPANPIRESMLPGQPVKFVWELNAEKAGTYDGTVWLSLRYLPLSGAAPSQAPVHVQEIKSTVISLFGISAPMARLTGGVGLILSAVFFGNDMIKFFRRSKGENNTAVRS